MVSCWGLCCNTALCCFDICMIQRASLFRAPPCCSRAPCTCRPHRYFRCFVDISAENVTPVVLFGGWWRRGRGGIECIGIYGISIGIYGISRTLQSKTSRLPLFSQSIHVRTMITSVLPEHPCPRDDNVRVTRASMSYDENVHVTRASMSAR